MKSFLAQCEEIIELNEAYNFMGWERGSHNVIMSTIQKYEYHVVVIVAKISLSLATDLISL